MTVLLHAIFSSLFLLFSFVEEKPYWAYVTCVHIRQKINKISMSMSIKSRVNEHFCLHSLTL